MIRDPDFEKSISEMVYQLAGPELASKIIITLIDNVACLGSFEVNPELGKGIILVNVKAKEMLLPEEGRKIVYAMLAHEVAHIKNCLEGIAYSAIDLFTKTELEADKGALIFLEKIYENPRDVLLMQIAFSLNAGLTCAYATDADKKLTSALATKRREALLCS